MDKTESELHSGITHAMAIFEDGVGKEYKAEKLANLLAAMEVYIDLKYTEEEQSKLFDIAGSRVAVLRKLLP